MNQHFSKDQKSYDMCILAGDFNSYEPPGGLSKISKLIR
jgi:hypothetical protein